MYDVINCLNKNLMTHFVWHLEKEIRRDIETLSIDRKLNNKHFYGKSHAKNVHQKLAPDRFLILLNNRKQPLHEQKYLKIKVFWKRIIKKTLKS